MHNASELRLTFAGHPDYSIWVPETVEVTLPAAAIMANVSIPATPQIVIWADAGALHMGGSLTRNPQVSHRSLLDLPVPIPP